MRWYDDDQAEGGRVEITSAEYRGISKSFTKHTHKSLRCTKTKTQSGRIYTLYSRRTCQLSEEFSIRSPNERTLHHIWSKKSIETEWLLFCVMQFSVLGQIILYAPLNGSRVIDSQENPRILCFKFYGPMRCNLCIFSDGIERKSDGATERRSGRAKKRKKERRNE